MQRTFWYLSALWASRSLMLGLFTHCYTFSNMWFGEIIHYSHTAFKQASAKAIKYLKNTTNCMHLLKSFLVCFYFAKLSQNCDISKIYCRILGIALWSIFDEFIIWETNVTKWWSWIVISDWITWLYSVSKFLYQLIIWDFYCVNCCAILYVCKVYYQLIMYFKPTTNNHLFQTLSIKH